MAQRPAARRLGPAVLAPICCRRAGSAGVHLLPPCRRCRRPSAAAVPAVPVSICCRRSLLKLFCPYRMGERAFRLAGTAVRQISAASPTREPLDTVSPMRRFREQTRRPRVLHRPSRRIRNFAVFSLRAARCLLPSGASSLRRKKGPSRQFSTAGRPVAFPAAAKGSRHRRRGGGKWEPALPARRQMVGDTAGAAARC